MGEASNYSFGPRHDERTLRGVIRQGAVGNTGSPPPDAGGQGDHGTDSHGREAVKLTAFGR